MSLIKEVEFTSLFTFIYSPREGTKAASMEDPVTKDEKSRWFKELCDLQESIASKRTAKMKDNIYKVLVEFESKIIPVCFRAGPKEILLSNFPVTAV